MRAEEGNVSTLKVELRDFHFLAQVFSVKLVEQTIHGCGPDRGEPVTVEET